MKNLGDFRLGDTIDFKFTTTAAATGAPTTLAGTPALSAYPGNSNTQITAGITLTVDFDAVTGLNHCRIVASSGNGYASGSTYEIVITTGTVGGTSAVGYVVACFSIEARSALMPTTGGRTLDVTAGGNAGIDLDNIALTNACGPFGIQASGTLSGTHSATTAYLGANAPASDTVGMTLIIPSRTFAKFVTAYNTGTGVATFDSTGATLTNGDQWYLVGTPTVSSSLPLPADLRQIGGDTQSATDLKDFVDAGYDPATNKIEGVKLADTLTTYTGNTPQTGDAFARIGANGAGLTALPWNAAWDAEVQSECADALTAYDAATGSDVATALSDLQSRLPASLVGGRMDCSVGAMQVDVLTSNAIAASAISEIQSGLATAAQATSIESDTQDIQSRLPAALVSGRMDARVGAMATDVLTSDAIAASAVTELQNGLATAAALDAVDNFVDTEMAASLAILNKLDTAMELDGSVYRFTVNALEQAPAGGGGGSTDWTADERAAIRAILGIPVSGTTPADPTAGILDTIRDIVAALNDIDSTDVQSAAAAAIAAYDPPTNAELTSAVSPLATAATLSSVAASVASILEDTGTSLPALINALNDVSLAEILTTQLAESYASNGTAPTLTQALLAIHQRLMDFSIDGTTRTVYRLDGSTPAFISTFDDASAPTSEHR